MNTKDFLKIAGVKSEKEFYEKFPTEEAFFEAYPQADIYRKGGKLKKKKQDPAHGYREFPPNVMAMGGGIIDMMETGGKLPESVLRPRLEAHMSAEEANDYLSEYKNGGYIVKKSNDRKGKTHVVIGPDGTKKYFGDPNMGEKDKSKNGKEAFYARHAKNLKNNPYFRAYAKATWEDGGYLPTMMQGGGSIPNMPLAQDGMESTAQSGYISPYEESKFNVTGGKRKPVAKNSGTGVGDNVLAMLYGMGEGLLDTITMGMTDELTDKGFEALQNMNYDTERQKRNQNAARGFANAGASIGGALINPQGSGEAMSQISEGITTGASSLSGKPVEPSAPSADSQKASSAANSMMSKFMGMGSSMMGKYGGPLKMEIGGPMPSSMGLNELTGPNHEEGGMAISPEVEVEGGETILEPASYVYSDSILVPGTKKTFAQASKAVKNKYKMREDDKLSQEAMNSELEALMNQQEEVKESMMIADTEKFQNKMMAKYGGSLMPDMYIDRNMQPIEMRKGGGIYIKPSKRGTFTAAAKKRGMGVQEFASKVMANKEDYSSAMVKKANFAKNAAKWKKQFGGFIEDEGMYGPVMMEDGGGMGVKKARRLMEFQDADMFEDPSKYEDIYQDENQLVLGEDTVDFKNERQARRFLNTLQSGKLNEPVENQPDLTSDNTEEKDSSFDFNKFRIPTTAIAGLSAAASALQPKQRFQLIPQATVNYINTRPAEVLAERQGELALAAGLGGLRDNATTQGNYLANVANLAAASGIGTGSNVANIRFQGDTQNLGISNQAALQRQATIAQNIDRREKFDTAQMLRENLRNRNAAEIGMTANLDAQKRQQQAMILKGLQTGDFKFDKNGELFYKSTEDGVETWKRAYI